MATKSFIVSGLASGATFQAAVQGSAAWLHVAVDSENPNKINVTVDAYTSTTADRNGTIGITTSDGATASCAVTQIRKSAITLTPSALSFDAAGN